MKGRDRAVFRTPLGWAGVVVSEQGVTKVVLPARYRKDVERELAGATQATRRAHALLKKAVRLLERYFAAKAVTIDLPLDLGTATPFQRAVWKAAASIPHGATRSYAWVARKTGRLGAARAVGRAMGANPVPVLVP